MLLLLLLPLLLLAVCVSLAVLQIRHDVLGFEVEQLLPPELGASLADLQQQQQQHGDSDDLSECSSLASCSDIGSQLRGAGQIWESERYKGAADKIKDKIAAGRQKVCGQRLTGWGHCLGWRYVDRDDDSCKIGGRVITR